MKPVIFLAGMMLLASTQAKALAPADFFGAWVVRRVAGASNVVSVTDPRKLLGTKLRWTEGAVQSAEGTCAYDHAIIASISNDKLQDFLWGGQTIAGLELPKSETRAAFGKNETPVYYDGGKGCIEAVMLSRNHVLFMFHNGYLYLLERLVR